MKQETWSITGWLDKVLALYRSSFHAQLTRGGEGREKRRDINDQTTSTTVRLNNKVDRDRVRGVSTTRILLSVARMNREFTHLLAPVPTSAVTRALRLSRLGLRDAMDTRPPPKRRVSSGRVTFTDSTRSPTLPNSLRDPAVLLYDRECSMAYDLRDGQRTHSVR